MAKNRELTVGLAARTAFDGLRWVALAALAVAVAYGAITFTRESGRVAAIWPLNAIFFVLALKAPANHRVRILAALLVGNSVANMLAGDPVGRGAMLAMANAVEVGIVTWMMTRRGSVRFLRRSSMVRFVRSVLVACAVSTAIALVVLAFSGVRLPVRDGAIWFAADTLGLLLFTPILWILQSAGKGSFSSRDGVAMAPELGLVLVVTLAVFLQSGYPLLFLVPPALIVLAFRRGVPGATAGLTVLLVISVGFTLAGRGPTMLIDGDLPLRVLVVQVFLAANALLALAVGAATGERRQLVARLKASKARMARRSDRERELIDQARLAERMGQIGYWTLTPATGEVFWSAEVYRIHGVTPEDFNPALGDALEFYPEADRAMIGAKIEQSLAHKTGWQFEADLQQATGKLIRVRSMAECRLNDKGEVAKIFGVFKDITADHQMLEKVREQEALYRLLADNSSDVIARYGIDSIFTYLSPSIEALLGYRPEELVGRSTAVVIHPEDAEHVFQTWRQGLKSNDSFAVEYRAVHKDGTILWLEARPTVSRDASGEVICFIDTVRDVTDRHERELVLAEATAAAEAATETKAAFLSNMSHEIRTPLNGVLGFADLLAKTTNPADQKRYIDRIRRGGQALLHVVNDILDFSKIEAGKMTVKAEPYDPAQLLSDVVELVKAAGPHTDIQFSRQVAPDLAEAYVGDEDRVRQILLNVVGNAAKFTRRGSVSLDLSVQAGRMRFVVTDDGPGIAANRIAQVFDGFAQADESISRNFGGTGLGLSISRSLARLMGGDLVLASEAGVGTTVTLDLPAERTTLKEVEAPARAAPGTDRPVRVMVVDDVEMNREVVELGLGQVGHQVKSFDSGEAALNALRSGEVYDIILMDVQMPGMDGLAATRAIRRLRGPPAQTPVVGLTANVLPEQAAACRAAGMDDHFGKPIDMDRLVALVARLVVPEAPRRAQQPESGSAGHSAMDALKSRYLEHLSTIPAQLRELVSSEDLEAAGDALAALAHSIAGTAGSLGFKGVSDAAFQLEAAGRRAETDAREREDLTDAVDRVIEEVTAATGSAVDQSAITPTSAEGASK